MLRARFESIIQQVYGAGWTDMHAIRRARGAARHVAGQLGAIAKSAHRDDTVLFYYVIGFINLLTDIACRNGAVRPRRVNTFLHEWHCRAAMGFCGHRITVRAGFAG